MSKTYKYTLVNGDSCWQVNVKGRWKPYIATNYPDARQMQLRIFIDTGKLFDIYRDGEKIS